MFIDTFLNTFKTSNDKDAVVWGGTTYSYEWLYERILYWQEILHQEDVARGSVVIIKADFSPNSIALFLALIEHQCVLVPLTTSVGSKIDEFIQIAQGECIIEIDNTDAYTIKKTSHEAVHEYYTELKKRKHPGLILFSSGSTGKSKAAVHDMVGILEKFYVKRNSKRTITFLLYDHIGGVNTMLYTLSNAGCIVTIQDRSPDDVLNMVKLHRVQTLPASPTFLNLILISEAYKRYDLSSLELVTYGTEPMAESTLKRFHEVLPHINLLQTYGLSEVGILRSKSKSSDSLWVKVGGEGFETRVIDGILQIKAKSAMLGYLNAESPFTEDGWFNTGDQVLVDGEYFRILGRKTEIINVGGEKVYPAEVESVIQEIDNVAEVTVYGEKNALTGNIVCAKITLKQLEDKNEVIQKVKKYCRSKLQGYKVPVRVQIIDEKQYSDRYKKVRTSN
jgi:acyl-coenzyme A synthetase/AMP-(fatty) acid ligase